MLLNSDTEVPARLAAPPAGAGIRGGQDRQRFAAVEQRDDLQLSGLRGRPDADAASRCRGSTRPAARSTPVASPTAPTTVGFCMYIRRAALDEAGPFDAKTFGKGYGEENDFCLRSAALGWRHHIACDTFVRHEGGASFGAAADTGITRALRDPDRRGIPTTRRASLSSSTMPSTEPFRFAATMALFRASGLPTVLVLSHDLEGGVRRHVHDVVERDAGRANYLVLEPASRGVALSVPALPGHPKLVLAAERWRDVAAVARSAGVTRVHIHHLMGLDLDARALIHDLGVEFDVTVHDYFAICPQVTLLPWSAGHYCGEPGPAGCDACIANRPSHGATDILSWRLRWSLAIPRSRSRVRPQSGCVGQVAAVWHRRKRAVWSRMRP